MLDLNAMPLDDLFAALVEPADLRDLFARARREDLGDPGDITSQLTVSAEHPATAEVRTRCEGVAAGLRTLPTLLETFEPDLEYVLPLRDGSCCTAGDVLATISGNARAILALERTLLNLLGRLSGIASLTRCYVQAVQSAPACICDTRKTTPGSRGLEKYAVRCGGGTLHRIGLFDAVLIKDNHLALMSGDDLTGALTDIAQRARTEHTLRFVEVEVDGLVQLDRVLACPPGSIDMILLDNMAIEELIEAVRRRNELQPNVLLEASGGVTLGNVCAIAKTGVDRISVGAITHSAPALDLGLDLRRGDG